MANKMDIAGITFVSRLALVEYRHEDFTPDTIKILGDNDKVKVSEVDKILTVWVPESQFEKQPP